MFREKFLDRLELKDDLFLDNQIGSKATNHAAAKDDLNLGLTQAPKSSGSEDQLKSAFIDRLKKPWAQFIVDIEASLDDSAAQIFRQ